jgi:hypothetical protein
MRTGGDEDVRFDGSWKDSEESVVDVLADEVNTPWSTSNVGWCVAVSGFELCGETSPSFTKVPVSEEAMAEARKSWTYACEVAVPRLA